MANNKLRNACVKCMRWNQDQELCVFDNTVTKLHLVSGQTIENLGLVKCDHTAKLFDDLVLEFDHIDMPDTELYNRVYVNAKDIVAFEVREWK